MPSGLSILALGLAMQVGAPAPSETPNFPAPSNAYGSYGFEGSSEQRHPYDTQQNWVHGYFQEIPAYGGHHLYRPYNYKDVLSQSQTAAGWGERPGMPYAQQFWHKYQDQATMLKTSRYEQPVFMQPSLLGHRRAPSVWTPVSHQTQIVLPSRETIHLPQQQIQTAPPTFLPAEGAIELPHSGRSFQPAQIQRTTRR